MRISNIFNFIFLIIFVLGIVSLFLYIFKFKKKKLIVSSLVLMLVGIIGITIATTIEINIKRETNDVYLKENYLNGNDNIEKTDDYF